MTVRNAVCTSTLRYAFCRYWQTDEEDFVNGFNYHASFDLESSEGFVEFPDYVTTSASAYFYMEYALPDVCEIYREV